MARIRNAFKIRAADASIIETPQFLQLYCPLLLEQLQRDDLFVPKLIVVRGSPGSGKSSLLRLFELDTLLAVHARRTQPSERDLVERLTELGVLSDAGPRAIGIYIRCDSSLRDTTNIPTQAALRLFDTLLDTRIVALFVRALRRLMASGCLEVPDDFVLMPLPSGETPPALFAKPRSLRELEERCAAIEQDFGTLLNSFPDDPLPTSIQPHARVYSLAYLGLQLQSNPVFSDLTPIVMLDDVQELYPAQRQHVKDEFIRRASVPRWLAVRTQVFGLEQLISVEGAEEGREFRELSLDEIFQERPAVFGKFAANVVHRRLQHTESLQQVTVGDFRDLLRPPTDPPRDDARQAFQTMAERVSEIRKGSPLESRLEVARDGSQATETTFDEVVSFQQEVISFERLANRGQVSLFPELEIPEASNAKTAEASRLFASRLVGRPYYSGFETLVTSASANVEQLLSTTAALVDRMIYRAELDRDKALSAKEQEEILRRASDDYYMALVAKHRHGSAIRQFVDNLALFFEKVTYKPNAPIAPGVNGFGLTPQELEQAAGPGSRLKESMLFREVLTNAVAGNVFSVRATKQGQAGAHKVVFYLNRLLCVRFRLPMNHGGWQHLPASLLAKMMMVAVPIAEMTSRGAGTGSLPLDEERERP